jgi:hypothetical protein
MTDPSTAERDRLTAELSELAIRMLEHGGPGALAAWTVAMVEGAAAGVPGPLLPEFIERLLRAVSEGANRAGHQTTVVDLADMRPQGGMH